MNQIICLYIFVTFLNTLIRSSIPFPYYVYILFRFYEKFKIPGTIGCIDGTLISMVRPKEHEERFYCRKGYHARNAVIVSFLFITLCEL